MALGQDASEPTMDPAALYREDTYTDRRIGTIRVLTPVKTADEPASVRKVAREGDVSVSVRQDSPLKTTLRATRKPQREVVYAA